MLVGYLMVTHSHYYTRSWQSSYACRAGVRASVRACMRVRVREHDGPVRVHANATEKINMALVQQ